jgi:hypothetical protein
MNFGALARALFKHLQSLPNVDVFLGHHINFIERRSRRSNNPTAPLKHSKPSSSSSAPAAVRCPFWRRPKFPRPKATGGFPSAASGSYARTRT